MGYGGFNRSSIPTSSVMNVSVVLPTFNRAQALRRAINSVLNQEYSALEIIVVDDASSDNTAEVMEGYDSERVIYVRLETNVGGAGARNVGIERAAGTYVAFLDSDDEWLPNHLRDSVSFLQKHRLHGMCSSFFIDESGRVVPFICEPLAEGQSIADYILNIGGGDVRSSTLLFDRESIMNVFFDPTLRKYQDWDLAIRFSREYRFGVKKAPSVILHVDESDRMSARSNPEATSVFLDRYLSEVEADVAVRVYSRLMMQALREGSGAWYKAYRQRAWNEFNNAGFRSRAELLGLSWPPLGNLLISTWDGFRKARRSMQSSTVVIPSDLVKY